MLVFLVLDVAVVVVPVVEVGANCDSVLRTAGRRTDYVRAHPELKKQRGLSNAYRPNNKVQY